MAGTTGWVVCSEVKSHGSSPTGDIFKISSFVKIHFQLSDTSVHGSVRVSRIRFRIMVRV